MKRYVKCSNIGTDFRVYFRDGNQKLLNAENIVQVVNYLVYEAGFNAADIVKIEEMD